MKACSNLNDHPIFTWGSWQKTKQKAWRTDKTTWKTSWFPKEPQSTMKLSPASMNTTSMKSRGDHVFTLMLSSGNVCLPFWHLLRNLLLLGALRTSSNPYILHTVGWLYWLQQDIPLWAFIATSLLRTAHGRKRICLRSHYPQPPDTKHKQLKGAYRVYKLANMVHPEKIKWILKMEVWKMIFLCNWVILGSMLIFQGVANTVTSAAVGVCGGKPAYRISKNTVYFSWKSSVFSLFCCPQLGEISQLNNIKLLYIRSTSTECCHFDWVIAQILGFKNSTPMPLR